MDGNALVVSPSHREKAGKVFEAERFHQTEVQKYRMRPLGVLRLQESTDSHCPKMPVSLGDCMSRVSDQLDVCKLTVDALLERFANDRFVWSFAVDLLSDHASGEGRKLLGIGATPADLIHLLVVEDGENVASEVAEKETHLTCSDKVSGCGDGGKTSIVVELIEEAAAPNFLSGHT